MSSFDEMDAFEGASLSARAVAARPMPYLDGLNPAQRQAVETLNGPVLMLAGAGTGKTKALTARIVHLLNTNTARPNEILAVTFTNKAAREMKNRVGGMLGQAIEGMPWLGTFHAICVKLLRRHAELIGFERSNPLIEDDTVRVNLKSNFTILDTDDQLRLLKQLVAAANIDDKRWPARQLAGIIDGWKNRALTPDKVPSADAGAYNHRGVELYEQYQQRLIELNAVDFGDLLLHMVVIFQTHADVLEQYQRWFRYILVDEYQDTNVAQYLWLRLLAGAHKNICCVGDDDQSIYGWRGAEVGNILRFEKDFPGAHVVRLEQNYRSTPHILAAASNVIRGNEGRLGKELWTDATEGEKVRLIGHWDGEEEARWIGEEIEGLYSGSSSLAKRRQNPRSQQIMREVRRLDDRDALLGLNSIEHLLHRLKQHKSFLAEERNQNLLWELTTRQQEGLSLEPAFLKFDLEEMAILVRASHQMRAFEDRFLTIGLPYRVIGGPRFYERMEIRDAMAYFRVVTSPDDDLAFERIVNTPKRGLGDKAQQTIQTTARANGVSLVEGARLAVDGGLIKGKGAAALRELVDGIARWGRMAGDKDMTHMELAEIILDESGYTGHWQNDKTPEAPGRLENLKELVKALEQFENLQGFLEHVSLIMDNASGDEEQKVSIMTLHAAKGLEFPAVFLPGWEDGLFPSQRSMDESGLKGLEEERRLAYVGITRAEEVCTISFAGNRRVFGQWQSALPSRFIDELPEDHVDVLTPPGLYGGGYGAAGMGGQDVSGGIEARVAEANVYNSPGWKRMQARSGQRGMSQPSESRNSVIDLNAVSSFTVGDRVFHQKFGYGAVTGIEGDKLEIEFEKAGAKKVVARFVSAADDIPF
jgi:ATP-dependent DNA helicase UvrD/PcrA